MSVSDHALPASREPLTLKEVQLAGFSADRLARYRASLAALQSRVTFGSLSIGGTTMSLGWTDTTATLALLIEREEVFLTGLGVEINSEAIEV